MFNLGNELDAATDGGLDWWSMSVAGNTLSEYHQLAQTVSLPAGVSVGDYVQVSCEFMIFSTTAPGLLTFQIQANGTSNFQSAYVIQTSRDISTFTTESPILDLQSEPMQLTTGTIAITLAIRVGLDPAGGTAAAKVGFRKLRIDKVPGPIYP